MSQSNAAPEKFPPTGDIRLYVFHAVAFLGAVLVVIGSLGTWGRAVITVLDVGGVSYSGTDKDGKYTLLLGIGISVAILLCAPHPRLGYSLAILGSLGALALAARAWSDISDLAGLAPEGLQIEVGWGLWLVMIGGAMVLGGITLHLAYNPEVAGPN